MRDRDLDLLEFEIEEIDAVAPTEEEKADLDRARSRLASVETLRAAAEAAMAAIEQEGDYGVEGAASRLARVETELARASTATLAC